MTDNQPESRLDRIERILETIAKDRAYPPRIPLNNTELTDFVRVHNAAIERHEQAVEQHDSQIAQINATLDRIAQLQAFNQEQLNQFNAGMIDLRNQVADFVKSREQPK